MFIVVTSLIAWKLNIIFNVKIADCYKQRYSAEYMLMLSFIPIEQRQMANEFEV